ncbi:MAG: T9SS type A sorting domain-containing protein [Ignavibacteria bacterium]
MKKLISVFLVSFFLCSINLFASVATEYTFTSALNSYAPLTGTVDTIAVATHTSIDPFQLNDVTYGPIALPFTFVFDCTDYNSFFVNTNGFVTFGTTAPGIANYGPISSLDTYNGAVSAFGRDLIGVFGTTADFSGVTNVLTDVRNFQGVVVGRHITAATGIPANTYITAFNKALGTITMSKNTTDIIVNDLVIQIASGSIVTKTEGTAPFRVQTIQFSNFRQYLIIGTDDNFNFQIKLYESGRIQVVYGKMSKNTIPVASIVGQVGLRGNDNLDFNSRTNSVTLNWATSTAGATNAATSTLTNLILPLLGQTYTWELLCALPVEMSSFTSSINGRDVTLAWTTTSEVNNSRFEIERSVSNEWTSVGSVEGNGTTLTSTNYSFTDRNLNTGVYHYRLKQIDFNGNFTNYNLYGEVNVGIPVKFDLSQNYPNPFNPSTKINYDLPFDSKVSIKIFDMSGKEVADLVSEIKTAGYYTVSYNASNLSSGVYAYRISAEANGNNFVSTKKMILIK